MDFPARLFGKRPAIGRGFFFVSCRHPIISARGKRVKMSDTLPRNGGIAMDASAIPIEQQGVALCPPDFSDVEDFIPVACFVTRGRDSIEPD
jgi:hypothetical protein